MATALVTMTNQDPRFYAAVGPFLSRRAVVDEVGGTLWDDDDKTWIVALRDGAAAGFVSIADRRGRLHVESLYTVGDDTRLADRLVAAAAKKQPARVQHAKVKRTRVAHYAQAGFVEVETGSTANYAAMERPSV